MQFFHTKATAPVVHGLRARIPHFLSSPRSAFVCASASLPSSVRRQIQLMISIFEKINRSIGFLA